MEQSFYSAEKRENAGMNDERRREEWLLKDAAILYERHKPDRPEPFNVFTTMFNERDEVKLHSRFLAVLLGHLGEEGEANLRDFVETVVEKVVPVWLRDFDPRGAKVERERHHIDILITNDHGQALAIENKIDAEDQHRQLKRYHEELERQGYKDIHLLYLTIDGREPSEDSRGDLSEKDYTPISYEAILPWLERCRRRAYDEPELRGSIAQYSRLIRRMTGNDGGSELMKELKELCLRDNNLLVAHHLAEALIHAKASLMHDMWERIKSILEENSFHDPEDFVGNKKKRLSDISESRIINVLNPKPTELAAFGLYYSFGQEPARLSVQADLVDGFVVGVLCDRNGSEEKYDEIKDRLENLKSKIGRGRKPDDLWPWWYVLRPDGTGFRSDHIEILADENRRNELADSIANSAVEKLSAIRDEFATADS